MSRRHPALARIRELQADERQRRAADPDRALRYATVDLLSGCTTQYYADHALSEDLERLDRARALLEDPDQYRSGSGFEALCLGATEQLAEAVAPRRAGIDDLDVYDDLRALVATVPPLVILGRDDEESPADLLCWNEANCLLEGVTEPYRCASAISVLGFLGAADRYRVIDSMVDLRRRYEADPPARPELDIEIRDASSVFVEWLGRDIAVG